MKKFILFCVSVLCLNTIWPAIAEYAIIAEWDVQNRVTRYNYVRTEVEAQAIINKLHNTLPLEDRAPNAYYVLMPPVPAGYRLFKHRARFWIADPPNMTVSVDTAAVHAWQSNITSNAIDREADRRADKVFSPDNLSRANRIRAEMSSGPQKIALFDRVKALRMAAQTLKDSLVLMTAEDILDVKIYDNKHWPE